MVAEHMRLYAGEADLEAIADLFNACEVVDKLNENMSVSELRQAFKNPSMDIERRLCLWEDIDGQLVGIGWLLIPPSASDVIDGSVGFRVHPRARDTNLERQIIAWSKKLLCSIGDYRGISSKLRCTIRDEQSNYISLLNNYGFTTERYFFSMMRSLASPIPQPQIPATFIIRQVRAAQDALLWVELFNESFIDHWNHHDYTIEDYYHWLSDANYKPDLDLVAIACDGKFAAFCRCWINSERNSHSGIKEGSIDSLGTRRGFFRRMGLGRAMLLSGMQRLKANGMDTAKLNVDADNPNSALQLYESVGFSKVSTRIRFVKDV